jgi:thiol-disulfide isomerase/thioredoxin
MRIVLLVISVLTAFCCTAQSTSFLNADKVSELSGKILNYRPNENNRVFSIRILPVHWRPENVVVPVNSDGSFTIQFTQPYTGNHHIKFAGKVFDFYFIAGAKETIEIDEKLLLADGNKTEAVIISGESGIVTSLLLDWMYKYGNKHLNTQVDLPDTSRADKEVIDLYLQKMKKELTNLETYTRENGITNPVFQNWAKNEIMYRAGFEAASIIQSGERSKKFLFTDMLHISKNIPVTNPYASQNSYYYIYLRYLAGNMTLAYNMRPAYEQLRIKTGNNAIPHVSAIIDSISTGEARQLLYFYLFTENVKKAAYYRQEFDNVVLDKRLKNTHEAVRMVVYDAFKEFNLLEKLKAFKVDAGLKSRLISLFEKEKDKFVYLDFWGNWCGPCMEEMRFYGSFIDRFKDKKITFIFMGVNTPEKEAVKVKNKFRVNGRFVTLTETEVEILRSLLDISGYPTHKLLKPGSIVTNYGAEKITDGTTLHPIVVQKLESILTNAQ